MSNAIERSPGATRMLPERRRPHAPQTGVDVRERDA
jgi:hypothetical protein